MRLATDGHLQRALGVVLGVDVSRLAGCHIDRQALRTSFRRQAHRFHPDKAQGMGLSEHTLAHRFRELKQAYDYLLALVEAQKATTGTSAPTSEPAAPAVAPSERCAANRSGTAVGAVPARPGTIDDVPLAPQPSARIPKRRLRFAQYLYYAHVIDWSTLLKARRWQHRTRPYVGEIAREIGLLSGEDVDHVLRHRQAGERFGDAALRLGRLDHVRLLTILARQHRLARPIGRYFLEHNILTPAELNAWLQHNWVHNLSVAATELGLLGETSVSERASGDRPTSTP